MDGLALLEAFLDGGLALVSLEDMPRGEGFVVAEERVHPIGLVVVSDGFVVVGPLEVEVARVRRRFVAAPGRPGPRCLKRYTSRVSRRTLR